MSSHCLLILSLIFPLPSISIQTSSCNEDSLVETVIRRNNERPVGSNERESIKPHTSHASLNGTDIAGTTNLRSWKDRIARHRHRHFRNAHGILNIIGWGTLLPAGAIIARSFSKFPLHCEEWYNLHVVCQTLGYIVGTIGWSIGMWVGNSSKQTHRNLGIIIFAFATVQMLALCLQPKREKECHRWWKIYHKVQGYGLISVIVANIFKGIDDKGHAETHWKWAYVGILSVLGFTALGLEIFRIVKARIHQQMVVRSNLNISS